MANPFFDAMGGPQRPQQGQRNLAPSLIQFMQGFQGDPMQQLQNKLNEVGATQQQYNQLRSMAEDSAQKMMRVLPRR